MPQISRPWLSGGGAGVRRELGARVAADRPDEREVWLREAAPDRADVDPDRVVAADRELDEVRAGCARVVRAGCAGVLAVRAVDVRRVRSDGGGIRLLVRAI